MSSGVSTRTTCPNSGQASFSHSQTFSPPERPSVAGWPQVAQTGRSSGTAGA